MAKICSCCHYAKQRHDGVVYCNHWQSEFGAYSICSNFRERSPITIPEVSHDHCPYVEDIFKKFAELDKELAKIKERLKNGK